MMAAETSAPTHLPDRDKIRQHLEHLFGGDLCGYHDGLIEIAWTDPRPDASGRHSLNKAAYFPATDLDAAADEAVKINRVPNQNVYVGAALRKPETPLFGRSDDDDFYAATCVYADLDDADATQQAKARYERAPPTQIIVTGRTPHLRAQLWWRLEEPITNARYLRSMNEGICASLRGDPTVVNVGRVMRLGGTIAWPLKPGRVVENTEIKKPGKGTPTFYIDTLLNDIYPPSSEAVPSVQAGIITSATPTGSLGLTEGKIVDGREAYMVKTIMACMIEFCGTNGCAPEPQELFDVAWPQYASHVDFSRPGRRQDEFANKVRHTLKRFEIGRIKGIETLEAAVAAYQAKPHTEPEAPRPVRNDDGEIELEEDGIRDLPTIDYDDIKPTGNVHTLVHKLIGPSAISMLVAPGGAYKSFLALDIALAVAQGKPWRGRKTTQGIVIYVAAEGAHGMRQRVQAYRIDRKTGTGIPFVLAPASLNLTKGEGDARALLKICKAAEKRFGLPVVMIVVDTLHRNYGGADENDASAAGAFMQNLDLVREATGAHIMVVHHTGKEAEKGARGSSSLKFAIDTEIVLAKGEMEGAAQVTRQKDGAEGEIFPFKMRVIDLGEDEEGAPINSLVIDHTESNSLIPAQRHALNTKQKLAMDALNNHFAAPGAERTISLDMFRIIMLKRGVIEDADHRSVLSRLRQSLERMNLIYCENKQVGLFLAPSRGVFSMFGGGEDA